MSWWLCGGRMVLLPGSFDGAEVWRQVAAEGVNILILIGDAMARPLLDAWEAEGPFEVPSLYTISSGGAPLHPTNKTRLQEILPNLILADGYGSSETGSHATQRLMPGEDASKGTRFAMDPAVTCVLDENLQPVEPGSGNMGRVARTGRMPLRYYGDPKKTAETFVEVGGVRWAVTGDQATVDTDGTITVLGRGSVSINTGGEKVFPEEVEAALKTHPGVFDTVVVGVPDERLGEVGAAFVVAATGTTPDPADRAEIIVCSENFHGRTLAIVGFSSAIGAYGGFFIPLAFASSMAATGGPADALYVFLGFYLTCTAVNWVFYARKNSILNPTSNKAA